MSKPVRVSVVVSCRDDEAHIERCIRAAQAQEWPHEDLEILVADGMSIDATREILARLSAEDARIKLVDNPARTHGAGLNECVRRAGGDVIARMCARADYAPDFVRQCVRALDQTGADNVGGAARAKTRTFFQRCVAAALESPLGASGSRRRGRGGRRADEDAWPGAFRRDVFERVGLFDPNATTNEDVELGQRITDSGGRVYQSGDIVVHYYPRESPRALARQYFHAGQGLARTFLKHRKLTAWRPALPFLWLAGEMVLLAASPPFGAWSLATYALATGAEAVRVVSKAGVASFASDPTVLSGPVSVAVVWSIFPILHVSHGAGFAAGLVRYALRPDWAVTEKLGPSALVPQGASSQ